MNIAATHETPRHDAKTLPDYHGDTQGTKTAPRPGKSISDLSDNPSHRAIFALPPVRESAEHLPAVQTLPRRERVTGDDEVDAVLWLRAMIGTGDPALITQAQEAAKRIRTPLSELEERYTEHLRKAHPGNPFATLSSFGFADLDRLAEQSITRRSRQTEALARFGSADALFAEQPAEAFCATALAGLANDRFSDFDKDEAAARFKAHPLELPHTLADCLHELAYWDHLYRLRYAVADCGDPIPEATARDRFVFRLLAEIPPRDRDEARAVFDYLYASGRDDQAEARAILANLIG